VAEFLRRTAGTITAEPRLARRQLDPMSLGQIAPSLFILTGDYELPLLGLRHRFVGHHMASMSARRALVPLGGPADPVRCLSGARSRKKNFFVSDRGRPSNSHKGIFAASTVFHHVEIRH